MASKLQKEYLLLRGLREYYLFNRENQFCKKISRPKIKEVFIKALGKSISRNTLSGYIRDLKTLGYISVYKDSETIRKPLGWGYRRIFMPNNETVYEINNESVRLRCKQLRELLFDETPQTKKLCTPCRQVQLDSEILQNQDSLSGSNASKGNKEQNEVKTHYEQLTTNN